MAKMSAKLWQIIYEGGPVSLDEKKSKCYPFADLYFNDSLTIFFENAVIAKLVSESESEKIAVCSWKLRQKLRLNIGKRTELTQNVINSDYEVLSFTKNTKDHQMLAAAERWHKGFKATMTKLCQKIGLILPGEVKIPIYQNHFSAKTEIYQDYVNNFLKPAMYFMTLDEEMHTLAMVNSNYSELTKENCDHLKEKIGIGYFPMAPFILERLFSIYVQNKKIKVTQL